MPEHFNTLLQEVGKVLSDTVYTEKQSGLSPQLDIDQLRKRFYVVRDNLRVGNVEEAFRGIVDGSVNMHHPGFFSQQLAAPAPISAIADMLVSALNQGHAVFDMSPINSLIEDDVLDWARQKLLLPKSCFGIVTSGGSISNLSGLLAARNYLDQWSCWDSGKGGRDIVVVASKQSHYSISKAVGVIGIGTKNVLYTDVDAEGRIEKKSFHDTIRRVVARGALPIVCLTIATTCTGAVDPLSFCVETVREMVPNAWIHVDAAHGGYLAMAGKYHDQFETLSNCDSITWDAHKMLFQSIPLSFLFLEKREKADFLGKHESPYLTQRQEGEFVDRAKWSLECSRRSNAVKLWCTLQYYGEEYFVSSYTRILDRTSEIYEYLKAKNNFHVPGPPESNIVAFRYMTHGRDEEAVNRQILLQVNDNAKYLIGFTNIEEELYLRLTVINPRTSFKEVCGLFSEIEEIAMAYLLRSQYG